MRIGCHGRAGDVVAGVSTIDGVLEVERSGGGCASVSFIFLKMSSWWPSFVERFFLVVHLPVVSYFGCVLCIVLSYTWVYMIVNLSIKRHESLFYKYESIDSNRSTIP